MMLNFIFQRMLNTIPLLKLILHQQLQQLALKVTQPHQLKTQKTHIKKRRLPCKQFLKLLLLKELSRPNQTLMLKLPKRNIIKPLKIKRMQLESPEEFKLMVDLIKDQRTESMLLSQRVHLHKLKPQINQENHSNNTFQRPHQLLLLNNLSKPQRLLMLQPEMLLTLNKLSTRREELDQEELP